LVLPDRAFRLVWFGWFPEIGARVAIFPFTACLGGPAFSDISSVWWICATFGKFRGFGAEMEGELGVFVGSCVGRSENEPVGEGFHSPEPEKSGVSVSGLGASEHEGSAPVGGQEKDFPSDLSDTALTGALRDVLLRFVVKVDRAMSLAERWAREGRYEVAISRGSRREG
jgi:hypothetical protein